MSVNRGKQFETVLKEAFEKVPNTSVTRIHDQMTGFKGSTNICDFLIFHSPFLYAIECKSIHGNTLPFSNITDNQWKGLEEISKIRGVIAGVMVWFIDKDTTMFFSIRDLNYLKREGHKSIKYLDELYAITLCGKKKRIFFEYDMEQFFKEAEVDGIRDKRFKRD